METTAAYLPAPPPETAEPAEAPEPEVPLPQPTRPAAPARRAGGGIATLVLVFLIPYAIVMTFAVGWLYYLNKRAVPFDPLERLPDPKPGEGGPKRTAERVRHDSRLPEKLKTALNKPLEIGDTVATPLRIERTEIGEVELYVVLKNASKDVAFDPLPNTFVAAKGEHYTFLEFGDRRIYGGVVQHSKGPPRPENDPFTGILRPGEEATYIVRTHPYMRKTADLIPLHKGQVTWRVQIRRGLVQVGNREVSATAVLGVVFPASAVPKQAAEDAALE